MGGCKFSDMRKRRLGPKFSFCFLFVMSWIVKFIIIEIQIVTIRIYFWIFLGLTKINSWETKNKLLHCRRMDSYNIPIYRWPHHLQNRYCYVKRQGSDWTSCMVLNRLSWWNGTIIFKKWFPRVSLMPILICWRIPVVPF